MQRVVLFFLKGYRYLFSPFLGQNCRFHPTCSEYAIKAVERYGVLSGSWLILRRVSRCQPFHSGGFDPVPEQGQHPSPCSAKEYG